MEMGRGGEMSRLLRDGSAAALDDARLLDGFAARGDALAFAVLVRRHGPAVMAVCRAITGHAQDAEDAFQATFLVLAARAGRLGRPDRLAGWLATVARRTSRRARALAARRRARESSAQATRAVAAELPDPVAEAEVRAILDGELARLPEDLRRPLVLCDVEGRSTVEAAALLGWPRGTVSTRLTRARSLLRGRLTRRGVGVSAVALSTSLVESTARAATLFAAGTTSGLGATSARATSLGKGTLMSMKLHRFQAILALILTAAGAGLAVRASATGPREAQAPPATSKAQAPAPAKVDKVAAALKASTIKMRGIALASHQYQAEHNRLPAAWTEAPDGTPLLSWRVALLPHMNEQALFDAFKRDEPWDSPHNLALLPRMPRTFAHSLDPSPTPTTTHFQVFVGDTAPFVRGNPGADLTAIKDGPEQTFLAVETAEAVPWTKPGGIPDSPDEPLPNLGVFYGRRWPAVMLDGSVLFLPANAPEELIRRAITPAGGVSLDINVLQGADPATPKAATPAR